MPDTEIQRIRRPEQPFPLRRAPPAAPGLQEPSSIGKALGYQPSFSLGDQVGRWYERAGGLDNAASSAQKAMENRDPKVLDGLLWPKWDTGGLKERLPVSDVHRDGDTTPNGTFFPSDRSVFLKPGVENHQAVLEHEGSHALFLPQGGREKQQRAMAGHEKWDIPHGEEHASYTLDPAEVDARLAEIKRRYAHHTGKLVDSPKEAEKAFDWWRSYNTNLSPAINRDREIQIERPADAPTLRRQTFERYDSLPDQMKQQMFHRMPELVKGEDRIRSLRG